MKKPELLAPAGNLEKLKIAVLYGADAVYLGGQNYGLRAFTDNFTFEEMQAGVDFAHKYNVKVYVTVNIFFHNDDLNGLIPHLKKIAEIGADGIIVSDPGIVMLARKEVPELELHLSTQANTTNWASACFWYEQGVKRIILARELSLQEIKEIREKTPRDLMLEVFIHGAMCISYSGRCLLSNYMAYRDSNRGECAHPCRWKYYLMEEQRPGEYLPVFEDDRGTYILNSKDLCMIHKIPEMVETGVDSFKIEGRMKSVHYVASVVKAYREAIDTYFKAPQNYKFNPQWLRDIEKSSHREFTTGFYFGKPTGLEQIYGNSSYIREYDFVGLVVDYKEDKKLALVEQRNRFCVGEVIEFFGPKGESFSQRIEKLWDENGNEIDCAPHPQQKVMIKTEFPVSPYCILRRERDN
jgi:putative protease